MLTVTGSPHVADRHRRVGDLRRPARRAPARRAPGDPVTAVTAARRRRRRAHAPGAPSTLRPRRHRHARRPGPRPARRRHAGREGGLGAIRYSRNETWLHRDSSVLPRRAGPRASWNYRWRVRPPGPRRHRQLLDEPAPGHRRRRRPRRDAQPDRPHRPGDRASRMHYDHPIFTVEAVEARARLRESAAATAPSPARTSAGASTRTAAAPASRPPRPSGCAGDRPLTSARPAGAGRRHRSATRAAARCTTPSPTATTSGSSTSTTCPGSRGRTAARPLRRPRPPRRGRPGRHPRRRRARPAPRGCRAGRDRVLMLANARVLGHTFDPLSVFWCLRPDGSLRAVVFEVHNTYGERHAYLLDPTTTAARCEQGLLRLAVQRRRGRVRRPAPPEPAACRRGPRPRRRADHDRRSPAHPGPATTRALLRPSAARPHHAAGERPHPGARHPAVAAPPARPAPPAARGERPMTAETPRLQLNPPLGLSRARPAALRGEQRRARRVAGLPVRLRYPDGSAVGGGGARPAGARDRAPDRALRAARPPPQDRDRRGLHGRRLARRPGHRPRRAPAALRRADDDWSRRWLRAARLVDRRIPSQHRNSLLGLAPQHRGALRPVQRPVRGLPRRDDDLQLGALRRRRPLRRADLEEAQLRKVHAILDMPPRSARTAACSRSAPAGARSRSRPPAAAPRSPP